LIYKLMSKWKAAHGSVEYVRKVSLYELIQKII
jgi:hypothetical protein